MDGAVCCGLDGPEVVVVEGLAACGGNMRCLYPFDGGELMKCAIAESYTHIGQVQIDKGEVRDRASVEHNREDKDHTGTPVRERELRVILELTWYTS